MTGVLTMPTEEEHAMEQLKRDFESYMKGEEPALLELERAPLLENWRTIFVRTAIEEAPKAILMIGTVTGHPQHPAGLRGARHHGVLHLSSQIELEGHLLVRGL